MQGTEQDIDNAIATLVEKELIRQIKDIYEDVTTTSKIKREKREKCTKSFVELYSKELLLAKDRIGNIVDMVVAQEKWIKEIEELDEEIEEK